MTVWVHCTCFIDQLSICQLTCRMASAWQPCSTINLRSWEQDGGACYTFSYFSHPVQAMHHLVVSWCAILSRLGLCLAKDSKFAIFSYLAS